MTMNIILLGTGVAIPQPHRMQSGILVNINSKPILFDCGSGVLARILESGYNHTDINTVFLSHLHLDHVADLLCLIKANWLCGKDTITIYAPIGAQIWINNLLRAYSYLQPKVRIEIHELSGGDVIKLKDIKVTCTETVHSVPSLGYKILWKDKAIVYSGDTEPCNNIIELSDGADLLIHECSFPDMPEVTNHTTPTKLSEMISAKSVDIGQIVLTHLYPETRGHEREMLECIQQNYKGHVGIGRDLQKIEL
ncbi:MAG: MBL fold metallo-hydrolase [Methanosarcinales archaeon]